MDDESADSTSLRSLGMTSISQRVLTRRHITGSTLAALAALLPASAGRRMWSPDAAAVAQPAAALWSLKEGLRLAGPVQGVVSLDPALSRDLPTNFLVRQIFRGLVRFDERLSVVPELAETTTVSEDGLRYTFVLRDGITYHDGRPITAADVLESLSRALRPATAGGAVDGLAGLTYLRDIVGAEEIVAGTTPMLAGVDVHDERRLTISIREPSATFPMKLASVPASIVDRSQIERDATWAVRPCGSGPFRCESFTPGRELVLAPHSGWWAGAPAVPRVHIRLGPSASQPINLFAAGAIDIVDDIPPEQHDLWRDPASGFDPAGLIETPLFAVSYIALGNREPPLDDRHIRRAVRLGFPSSDIAEARFDGAVRAATGLIPDGMLGRNWPVAGMEPDLEAARAEIRASRYRAASNVPPIAIHAADIEPVEALRDVVERDLGLSIDAVAVNWPDFLSGLAAKAFPAYSLYWGADYPDPESLLWMLFGFDSPENYTGYRNDEFDAILSEARAERDEVARVRLYEIAHRLLIEDAAVIPLYRDIGYTAVRRGIDGLTVTPMGLLGLETIRAERAQSE